MFNKPLARPLDEEWSHLLQIPKVDLAIVGGGVSALAVGTRLIVRQERARVEGASSQDPILDVDKVQLLAGGPSLSFSPEVKRFGKYLTLSGTDRRSRGKTLREYRDMIKDKFEAANFEFRAGRYATKITRADDGGFRVHYVEGGRTQAIESNKLVVAVGHSMRDVSDQFRDIVVQGSGDLCRRLACELDRGGHTKRACLDNFLSRYEKVDGEMRIGLAGFGASSLEVLKILLSLLDNSTGRYCTPLSAIPVKIVLFDAKVERTHHVVDGLISYMKESLTQIVTSESGESITRAELNDFIEAAEARLKLLAAGGQLKLIQQRFDWNSMVVNDGKLVANYREGSPVELSCVIDCAPFIEGLSDAQKSIIDELQPPLTFEEVSSGIWRTTLGEAQFNENLALIGAAFTPKSTWSTSHFHMEADRILESFFPRISGN